MTRADQLHGLVTRAVILGPQAQKDLRLGLGSATTVFKFSVIFKQWVLHFFFALRLTQYAAGPESFLVVQWLRHTLLLHVTRVCSLVWKLRYCGVKLEKKKFSATGPIEDLLAWFYFLKVETSEYRVLWLNPCS